QPDDLRGAFTHRGDLRVDKISNVSGRSAGREVGAFTQVDDLVRLRNMVEGQIASFHEFYHRRINRDFGKRPLVVFAARGGAIDAPHQLRDPALAVTSHLAGAAVGPRAHSASYH